MKKLLTVFALVALTFTLKAQSVVRLKGDTIKIYKDGGSAEVVILNRTRDTLGYLYNKGNGITEFRKVIGGDTTSIYATKWYVDSGIVELVNKIINANNNSITNLNNSNFDGAAGITNNNILTPWIQINDSIYYLGGSYYIRDSITLRTPGTGFKLAFVTAGAALTIPTIAINGGTITRNGSDSALLINVKAGGVVHGTPGYLLYYGADSSAYTGGSVLKQIKFDTTGGLLSLVMPYNSEIIGTGAANGSDWRYRLTATDSVSNPGLYFTKVSNSKDYAAIYVNAGGPEFMVVRAISGIAFVANGCCGSAVANRMYYSGTTALGYTAVNANDSTHILTTGNTKIYDSLNVTANPSSTNTAVNILNLFRATTGTAASGLGEFINYQLEDASGNQKDAGYIAVKWTTATAATAASNMDIGVRTNNIMSVYANIAPEGISSYGTGYGFTAQSGSGGGFFQGSSVGGFFQSVGQPIFANQTSTSTSTKQLVATYTRQGTYNAAAGAGIYEQWSQRNGSGTTINTGQISHMLTTVTNGAESASWVFSLINGGSNQDVLILKSTGVINAPQNLQNFANNAAALSGGLVAGDFYRNVDVMMVVH